MIQQNFIIITLDQWEMKLALMFHFFTSLSDCKNKKKDSSDAFSSTSPLCLLK